MGKLRTFLNEDNNSRKMLKQLHVLDDEIENFIGKLEDEIMGMEDNPVFIKKAHQLIADMSKEYSEFIMALRSIVNAVDRKGQVLPAIGKPESKVRDVLDGANSSNGPKEEEMESEEPETEDSDEKKESEKEDEDEYELKVAKKSDKKKKK